MLFEREAFVEFDLQFRRVRLAIVVARLLGVKQLEFSAVGPGDAVWSELVEPAQAFGGEMLEKNVAQPRGLRLFGEGQPFEGARQAMGNRGIIKGREFEFG